MRLILTLDILIDETQYRHNLNKSKMPVDDIKNELSRWTKDSLSESLDIAGVNHVINVKDIT